MRVLFAAYPSINQNRGGIPMRVLRTRQALREAGLQVELFDTWRHRVTDFDVLHVFKLNHAAAELVKCAVSRGVPTVISTIMPPEFPVTANRLLSCLWRAGIARQVQAYTLYCQAELAHALVALSHAEARLLRRAYPRVRSKIHVVPNCADAGVYAGAGPELFRRSYNVSDYVLTVGRIEPNKNQLRLIQAVRHLSVPLVVVGRVSDGCGAYAEACKDLGKGFATFIDELPYNSPILASAYAGARAFILPSVSEIAPLSAIEAAMSSTPVVVTVNSLASREYFGNDALYVEPLDVEDIEAKLRSALGTRPNCAFTERVIREHSWESCAGSLSAVYARVTGQNESVRPIAAGAKGGARN